MMKSADTTRRTEIRARPTNQCVPLSSVVPGEDRISERTQHAETVLQIYTTVAKKVDTERIRGPSFGHSKMDSKMDSGPSSGQTRKWIRIRIRIRTPKRIPKWIR